MRWLTNFYDFKFKSTATAALGIHPTKAWLSQRGNFKNAIWHFRITMCNKILFKTWKKNATQTYGMLQTAFGLSCMNREWVFEWHLWRMMKGVGGVRKSLHQSWLVKGLGFGLQLLCWGFNGVLKEFRSEEASTLQIGSMAFPVDNAPVHNSILVIDYLTKMGIKTVPHPPYSSHLAPCDF